MNLGQNLKTASLFSVFRPVPCLDLQWTGVFLGNKLVRGALVLLDYIAVMILAMTFTKNKSAPAMSRLDSHNDMCSAILRFSRCHRMRQLWQSLGTPVAWAASLEVVEMCITVDLPRAAA